MLTAHDSPHRHLQNADDDKVRKRWHSCQIALEEESRAVREKERRKTSSATPYRKIMAKLFDSEPIKASAFPGNDLSCDQKPHSNGAKTPSRTPKVHKALDPPHSHRVVEVSVPS